MLRLHNLRIEHRVSSYTLAQQKEDRKEQIKRAVALASTDRASGGDGGQHLSGLMAGGTVVDGDELGSWQRTTATEAAANVVRTVTTDHHTTEAADFGEKDDKEVQDDHARQTIGERLADGGYLRPGHG